MQKQLEQAYTPAKSSTAKGGKNGQSLVPPVYDVATSSTMPIQRKKKEEDDLKKRKPVQRKAKEEDLKKKKPLQLKKKDEEDLSKKKPLQRKAQPGDSSILIDAPDSPLEKEADAVAEQVVRRMSAPDTAEREPVRFSAGSISRTAVGGGAGALYAPAHVASELETSRGQGQALPESVRTDMEGVIEADLSGVRIHADAKAAELSEAVHAQAFTYGEDIYFNQGKYQPGSTEGRRLLGHEVGHVGQMGKTTNQSVVIQKQSVIKGAEKLINIGKEILGVTSDAKSIQENLNLKQHTWEGLDISSRIKCENQTKLIIFDYPGTFIEGVYVEYIVYYKIKDNIFHAGIIPTEKCKASSFYDTVEVWFDPVERYLNPNDKEVPAFKIVLVAHCDETKIVPDEHWKQYSIRICPPNKIECTLNYKRSNKGILEKPPQRTFPKNYD